MEIRFQDLPHNPTELVGIDRCYDYLAKRGVTKEDIEQWGIRILRCEDIGKYKDDRAAIVFPHRDIRGDVIDWWSARLIDVAPRTGFAAIAPPTYENKTYCPPKTPPAALLAAPNGLDWGEIPRGEVVYIHESCLKAINSAKCGKWSVGLNGVAGWASKNHEVGLVEQLRDIPWHKGLKAVIVFDANAAWNENVKSAIIGLAGKLKAICKVDAVHLQMPMPPEEMGRDWGFDDYCMYLGYAAGTAFLDSWEKKADEVKPSELQIELNNLNDEVVYVDEIKRVVNQETGSMMTRGEFCELAYANRIIKPKNREDKATPVAPAWVRWEGRRTVERLTYTPGGARIHEKEYLNLWPGMGVEPKKGDATPWLNLVERLIPDEKLRTWVIQWFAYPLQNLGAKMNSYIFFFGPAGGGKGAIIRPFEGIYGQNFEEISKENISSTFNDVYARKQFVYLDEMHGGTDRDALSVTNKIKLLVTGNTLVVNCKGKPEYSVDNHINLVTCGNYTAAMKLDSGDRRAAVIKIATPGTLVKGEAQWRPYFDWASSKEGQAALYEYLRGVDMTGFDAKGWAPTTIHKEDVTEATMDSMEGWCKALRTNPEEVLDEWHAKAPALHIEALTLAYVGEDMSMKATQQVRNRLGVFMRDAGFTRTENVRVNEKTQKRLWVLNPKLVGATDDEVKEAYMAWKTGAPKERKY